MSGKVIKSVYDSQDDILNAIISLHCPNGFDLDPTYSTGIFYRNIPQPRMKYDISPQVAGVEKGDSRNLPIPDSSVSSIVFDPPFCFGIHGKTLNNISAKRFTMFRNFDELSDMYRSSLAEFKRILRPGGILVFKCQDYTDNKTTMTHCLVWKWAERCGYYAKDLFILVAPGGRIYNPKLRQRHARKFHSYVWVFENKKGGKT